MLFLSYLASVVPLLLTLPEVISSPIAATSLLPLSAANLTAPAGDPSFNITDPQIIKYHIPGTVTSLEILTGAALSSVAMRTTLISCRSSIARAMYREGGFESMDPNPYEFPNVYSKDPRDVRFTGAAIQVQSTFAEEAGGLTWRQLDAVVRGLQEAMLAQREFTEARFKVYDGLTAKPEQAKGWLYATGRKPGEQLNVA